MKNTTVSNVLANIAGATVAVLIFAFAAWADWKLIQFLIEIFPVEGGASGRTAWMVFFVSLAIIWGILAFMVKALIAGGELDEQR